MGGVTNRSGPKHGTVFEWCFVRVSGREFPATHSVETRNQELPTKRNLKSTGSMGRAVLLGLAQVKNTFSAVRRSIHSRSVAERKSSRLRMSAMASA